MAPYVRRGQDGFTATFFYGKLDSCSKDCSSPGKE